MQLVSKYIYLLVNDIKEDTQLYIRVGFQAKLVKFQIEVLVKAGCELYIGVVSPNTYVPKALYSELLDRDIVIVVLNGILVSL